MAYPIIIISLIIQRNLATKIWAKQESSLTTVQLKQDPPVCSHWSLHQSVSFAQSFLVVDTSCTMGSPSGEESDSKTSLMSTWTSSSMVIYNTGSALLNRCGPMENIW